MPLKLPVKILKANSIWVLIAVALLVGFICVLLSVQSKEFVFLAKSAIVKDGIIVGGVNAEPLGAHGIWREVVRDLGIAFLVAAIVTLLFEWYVRSRADRDTITGILSTTMGDIIRPDVWQEVKRQVIEKRMIREKVCIRLEIIEQPDLELPPGAMMLWMQFDYELHGLRSSKEPVKVIHHLDDHIEYGDLPKFNCIKVNDTLVSNPGKRFSDTFDLEPRGGRPLRIITERYEAQYIPGSYNLMMWELTKGLTLHLIDLPDDIEAIVNLRPHKENIPLKKNVVVDRELESLLLLPGQSIEFRFKRKGH